MPYTMIRSRAEKQVEDILSDLKQRQIDEVTVLVIMSGAK